MDGKWHPNHHKRYNLGTHFKFMICQFLKQTMGEVLDDIRSGDFMDTAYESGDIIFTSTAILCRVVRYFRDSLRDGNLSKIGHVCIPALANFIVCSS